MAPKEFTGFFSPRKTPNRESGDIVTFFVKDAFSLPTLFLIGSVLQICLSAVLPVRVALLPAGLLGLYTIITSSIDAASGPKNTYMKDVILGRTSAQLPSEKTGLFGSEAAAHPLVVFHFGVRFNHPLGVLSPGAQATIDHFQACNNLVMEKAAEYGLLGLSPWRAGERGSSNTLMMAYYFRNVESLNKFAHDDIHKKAWNWIVKADHKHIGFFHEAFVVPAKAYESIYVNCPPLLMGAMDVPVTNESGENVWIKPLVSADVGPLRSQFGRMGRAVKDTFATES